MKKTVAIFLMIGLVMAGVFASSNSVQADDVITSVQVSSCNLILTVVPEKRVNASSNLQSELDIEIYDAGTDVYRGGLEVLTNNSGQAVIDLCNESISLLGGSYDFYIRGSS